MKHELNKTVLQAFNTIGEEQANLLMNQVTREYFEKTSILTTISAYGTRLYGAITRGISECTRKILKTGGKAPLSQLMSILAQLQEILKYRNVLKEIGEIKTSAASFLKSANDMIQQTLSEQKSSTSAEALTTSEKKINILRDQTMQQWKQTLIETSNQAIANQLIAPILSYGANQLVGFVSSSIKKEYRSYKEDQYRERFETLKKKFDTKVKDDKLNAEKNRNEVKNYHEALIKLLGKTKDAKLFANILRENVPMDMTCVQACTNVVHHCMLQMNTVDIEKSFTGVQITVQGTDGSSYEYSSSSDPSHTITLILDNKHFSVTATESTDISKNNCLYESLVGQIPALKTVFSDGTAFREHLADYIEHDENLQYVISQGWHKFAIKKESYGGAIKEDNYNPRVLYRRLINDFQKELKSVDENQHLSEKIQEYIKKCLRDTDTLAQDGSHAEELIRRIDELTQELNDRSNYGPKSNKELRKTMSTFRERISQTRQQIYEKNLEAFKDLAIIADKSPNDPQAFHVTDRVGSSRDDSNLERLVDKSTELRNEPNIIASIIHTELNKKLLPEDRRYNTVAVGIREETVYVAMNHVEINNNQQNYGIDDKKCEELCRLLASKNLLSRRYEVIFLEGKSSPKNQAECRAPHAEMQIMSFWKTVGILKDADIRESGKRRSIGASKPPCLCCSTAMLDYGINHKIFAKACMSPKNWIPFPGIDVKIKHKWPVQSNRGLQ